MTSKILLLSLDGIRLINRDNITENNFEFREIIKLGEIEGNIKSYEPDAVMLQVQEITDVVVYTVRDALKKCSLKVPWLCLVLDNTAFGERVARSNKVFFYGVGVEDLGFVLDAAKDAVRIGRQAKLEKKFLKQNLKLS